MADSSTSSLTSTSHTLTATPAYGSMASGSALPSLGDIASALAFRETIRQQARRESLLTPSNSLSIASAQISQVALGAFAGQISDEQQERIRQMHAATAARKKRKRNNKQANGAADDDNDAPKAATGPIGPILKIRRVHVDGFEIPQIWQQANRILETSAQQTQYALERLDEEDQEEEAAAEAELNGVDSEEELSGDDDDEEEDFSGLEGEEEDDEELSMGEDGEDDFDMEDDEDLEGLEDEEEEEEDDDDDEELDNGPRKEFVEDAGGLNDGFFDIDEFNKQSQWFEAQDARADPNTDVASEDEDLDWHGDPFAEPANLGGKKKAGKDKKAKKAGKKGRLEESDEEDDISIGKGGDESEDDEAPAFGDMDLDAPSGESDVEDLADEDGGLAAGMDMDLTANDIFYKDFFAPPAEKRQRGDRDRPGRKNQSSYDPSADKKPFQPEEEEVERAMNDVRRDLFEQLSDASGDEDEDGIDALSDVSAGDVRSRRSTHERRQAKILAEIRRLEAEAIKAKKWTLSGEATAGARPVNSLLEEDLDFEHIGKPVPVITQEVTEDIEALVKRRILEQSFDEVRRRYGTGFGEDDNTARRGLVDLDDQQSKKGLADIYEENYQEAANPSTYVSQTDEQQQGEEREVEKLWLDISAKLDALSNWQYKPRPTAPQMSVVSDVAAVAMEDAQPSTAQGVSGGASMLAPQEVYKPGADDPSGKNKDKNIIVVAKTGLPIARDEMTREEKQRRRRRNKERIRKSGSGMQDAEGNVVGNSAAAANGTSNGKTNVSQKETMATLKKAGVKVIGKKGELHDLEGNKPRAATTLSSGNFKL